MRRAFWGLGLPVLLQVACGGGTPDGRTPGRPLPPYTGQAVELFDDGLEPNAVGYPLEQGAAPMTDNRLRERTQTGDAVVRARVVTVTSKQEDQGRSWQIGMHTLERLAGTGPLEQDFTVTVPSTAPAAGIVHAFEGKLIGSTFVAFVREFERPRAPGDSDLHFHLAVDSKDEVQAVKSAVLLDQVR
ncbi:MAG TPA: hypothetical protein VIF15_01560 [Polyangiaceae bacterium]|jgi:hypothetical protein